MDIPFYINENIKNILEDYFKYYRNKNNKQYLTKSIILRCNTLLMLNNDLDKLTINDDYEKCATEFINNELVPNVETITFEEFFILFTKPNVIKKTIFKGLLKNKPFFDNIKSYYGIIIAILHNPSKYRLSLSNKKKENIIISLSKPYSNKSFNEPKSDNIIYIAFSFIIIYCTKYSERFYESIKLYSLNHDISEDHYITPIVDGFIGSQHKLYFGIEQNYVGSNDINIVETETVSILETEKIKSENSLNYNKVFDHIPNQDSLTINEVFEDKSESIKSEYDICMEPNVLTVPEENIPTYIFLNYLMIPEQSNLQHITPVEIQMLYWSQHILQQEQIHMNKLHVVESIKSYNEWLNEDEFPYIA